MQPIVKYRYGLLLLMKGEKYGCSLLGKCIMPAVLERGNHTMSYLHPKNIKKQQTGKNARITGNQPSGALSEPSWSQDRSARVARLRAQVRTGSGSVDSKALAASMLKYKARFS